MSSLFKSMLFNISFLSFLATILCRIRLFRDVFFEHRRSADQKILLIIIFSLMSIFATYIGTPYHGSILNARMIGVFSSGLLGGPIVGIPTAVIAGAHRYFYDPNGLTSLACAISTLSEGVIGSLLSYKYTQRKIKWFHILIISVAIEILQMFFILIISKPMVDAVEVVRMIAPPMIVMNTCGELVFIGTFRQILDESINVAAIRATKREKVRTHKEYEKRLLARAEFLNLQSQVNPHFLYNCLNTISYFCGQKPDEAKKMLVKLADYYRYSAEDMSDFVNLEAELEHVKTYLELEKNRFEESLNISLNVSDNVDMDHKIPSLILQPIVENAIKHGKDYKGNCHLTIDIHEESKNIIIQVKDRGEGFSKEIIDALCADSLPANNIGLTNVNKRLKMLTGNGLSIRNLSPGSIVTMTIPNNPVGEIV